MTVKIVNKSAHALPKYATDLSAGFDITANIVDSEGKAKEAVTLKPGQRAIVSTGLYIQLPEGTELQIRSRSGLAAKHGVIVLNSPGTIDADYIGEIGIILINLGDTTYYINDGDKVAQGVLAKHEVVEWSNVLFLDETKRGAGGFGSTGVK